jgi:hypothetical protein
LVSDDVEIFPHGRGMSAFLLLMVAAVSALGPRPPWLTGRNVPAYAAWLHARTLTADQAFGAPPCPAASTLSLGGRALGPGEAAPGPGRQAGPVYLERVRFTGCGRIVTHNLQVARLPRGGWDAVAVLPGASRATPRQQTDAMQPMAAAALNGAPALPCSGSQALRSLSHGEVRVVSAAGDAWTERWPLVMCGRDRTVEVTFRPGAPAAVTPAWSR